MKSLITATLSVLVLSSSAFAADSNITSCPLSKNAQKKHQSTPLNNELTYSFSGKTAYTAYDAKTGIIEVADVNVYCAKFGEECQSSTRTESLYESVLFQVEGSTNCRVKFVDLNLVNASTDLSSNEVPTDVSETEAANLWEGFKIQASSTCDKLNVSKSGQSKIEFVNLSTRNGFFSDSSKKVHLDFNARCAIQD
jgi:hypothetical protein